MDPTEELFRTNLTFMARLHLASANPSPDFNMQWEGNLSMKPVSNMDDVGIRFLPTTGKRLMIRSKLRGREGYCRPKVNLEIILPERILLTDMVIGCPGDHECSHIITGSRGSWRLHKGDRPTNYIDRLVGTVRCEGALILFDSRNGREWILHRNQ